MKVHSAPKKPFHNERLLCLLPMLCLVSCGPSAPGANGGSPGSAAAATTSGDENSPRPFKATDVATFDNPWAIAFLPNSTTALVTEKPGHVWLVDVSNGSKQPVSGVPQVLFEGQGGLLDVAVSPQFTANNLVYLTYSKPDGHGGSSLAMATAKLVRSPQGGSLDGLQVIWQDPQGGEGGQFGGRIAFAPDGQSLFLTSGERQRFTPAQDPHQPVGKIFHLTLDGKPELDNPWAGKAGAQVTMVTDPPEDTEKAKTAQTRSFHWTTPNLTPAETWSIGHRTPYGLAFAPDGRLWEAEAGPAGGDELNLIEKGKNYGWPIVSYGDNYNGVPIPKPTTRPDLVPPKVWWTPTVTPGGLLIYTGNKFPQWDGDALIPALNGQALIRVDLNGADAKKADRWDMGARMRGIAQGPDGAVYLLQDGDGAKLIRLDPR
jgi:glucose/arabinose dehydrogenase